GKFQELERKLQELETLLGQKVDRRDDLTDAARVNVESILGQKVESILAEMDARLKRRLTEAVQPLDQLMTGQASFAKEEFDKTARQIKQVGSEGEQVKQQLEDLLMGLGKVESRIEG